MHLSNTFTSRVRAGGPLLVLLVIVLGCSRKDSSVDTSVRTASGAAEDVLDLYIWADYIAPDALSSFERQTGIKVRLSYFDSPETLESRMLTGSSGFDLAVPTAALFLRQIRSGAFLPLDKSKLPNLVNLDPELIARVASNDPNNAHGIVYMWGTFGIGVNKAAVSKLIPSDALNSWRMVFDPALAAKVAKCGINLVDDPGGIVRVVLIFLGRNPNEPSEQDLADAERVLTSIRPFIRTIDTSGQIQALATGDVCVSVAYNGNVVQAKKRAKEAKTGIEIDYLLPKEGSLAWFDLMAIPKDAPHLENAYRFLDFLMDPHVIASISNTIGYANANMAATALLDPTVAGDSAVYPTPEQRQRLVTQLEPSPDQYRAIIRMWQRFKTAQ